MADPVITQGQYSIGAPGSSTAFVYGGRQGSFANNIQVSSTQVDTGTEVTQDVNVIGHDGMLFGIDTMAGMVVTQTGQANSPGSPNGAMDAYNLLAGAWNDPSIRLSNNAVQVLRAFYPGSLVVRRCYGRGRKIVPVMGVGFQGLLPWTAQFQASDGIWYSDTESSLTLTMTPSFTGGLAPPITPPYQLAAATNFQQNTAINAGPQPTWPIVTFTGPVSFPVLTYVGAGVRVSYNGILQGGDTLVVDTRPWNRTSMLNGQSAAGQMTGDPMIGLQLWPGSTVMRFTGQDFTGTGQCVIRWRNANLSIGGSL